MPADRILHLNRRVQYVFTGIKSINIIPSEDSIRMQRLSDVK
jgi:hypothetical protein